MDPYAPCPCGSGKKLKFCCQDIIGEMEKINRLQENNQPRMALQLLEKLDKTHPHHPWIVTHRAVALVDDQRHEEARQVLVEFLRKDPDHPFANALYAIASFNVEGYPAAKKAVHRAFRRSVTDEPGLVATLAGTVGAWHLAEAQYLAARQHMALALRFGDEQHKRRAFLALVEIDGDAAIPSPLRGVHHLLEYAGPESACDQVQKAFRLSAVGCWQEAADLLQQVSAQDPDNPALWQNIGLLRAWDGDETAAAQALHRAARLTQDFASGVESETVAQLLEQLSPERSARTRVRPFRVESVSRLLTQLDSTPQCVRAELSPDDAEHPARPAAVYHVIDRPLPGTDELDRLTAATLPRLFGRITVFDRSADGEEPAQAFVNALEGEPLEQSLRIFRDAAGDLASPTEVPDAQPDDDVTGLIPREQITFHRNWFFPPFTPGKVRTGIQVEEWNQLLGEIWPNTPQAALEGRTPLATVGRPDLKVALAAAVEVLDVFCSSRGYVTPLADLRARLQLDPPAPLDVAGDTNLNTLSFMQLRRLDLSGLSPEQFQHVLQRAVLVRHPGFLYDVLTHFLQRPEARNNAQEQHQAFATLGDICRDSLRREEAFRWLRAGRELAEAQNRPFEDVLHWKMRELVLRIDDPHDPELRGHLLELWNTYGAKLPDLRSQLNELVQALHIDPPWDSAILTPQAAGVLSGAAAWSPTAPEPAAAGKKLWLPGQS